MKDSGSVKAALLTITVTVMIALAAFVDLRYAHAADSIQFQGVMQAFIIDSYERDVTDLDQEIAEFESVEEHLTEKERKNLSKQKARRSGYLRKLERLKN